METKRQAGELELTQVPAPKSPRFVLFPAISESEPETKQHTRSMWRYAVAAAC
jgi:hypothetical protein